MNAPAEELLGLARTLAREAADHARGRRESGVRIAGTKSSEIDVVTEADRSTEELLRSRIQQSRPDDAIIGEEGADRPGTSGVRWIVDPIDGTVNYLYGLPVYAVSVAAAVGDEVVAAVVRNPVSGEEYAARLGGGATRNGEPIGVREPTTLAQSLVATGFNYERHVRAGQAEAVARMLPRVRDIRRMGSCALDLCGVAAGVLDAYVEEGPAVWDDAAGGLVAREAGAVLEVVTGRSGKRLVLCAPGHSFERFRELVRACGF
ncbi:MAG: inositol monophosphatase family protein [Marmoricola sp.]